MSRVIDALIAYRILKLLVTPFDKTDAFKQGIIDKDGKVLIKSKQIVNQKQRKAYTLLIRFVFNLKRLLKRVGLGSRFGTYAAAAFALPPSTNSVPSINLPSESMRALSLFPLVKIRKSWLDDVFIAGCPSLP